jgi:hypothetical protein
MTARPESAYPSAACSATSPPKDEIVVGTVDRGADQMLDILRARPADKPV